jgi:DNA sulfur modification protein DndB
VTSAAPAAVTASAPAAAGLPYPFDLPALRGVQAGREYWVAMVKLRDVPRLLGAVDPAAPPEQRAQRTLCKARVPKIARYLAQNARDYILPPLTGAIDGEATFEPAPGARLFGVLHIPAGTRVSVIDGQHRRAAISQALRENGVLCDESVPVVLYYDVGVERSQQQFADLNRFAVRPSGALGVLYDQRDPRARLARLVVARVPVFAALTDRQRTSCSASSPMLFSLSSVHAANTALLAGPTRTCDEADALAVDFWSEAAERMPDWQTVAEGRLHARELRARYVHAHAVALEALGRVGNALVRERPDAWPAALGRLGGLDWSRANTAVWEGRALHGGRLSKNAASVVLTANAIKLHLGLELGPEELRLEQHRRVPR